MQPDGVVLVNAAEWLGLLRWIALAILVAVTIALYVKKNKDDSDSKASSIAAFVTLIAAPFLILNIVYKQPEPTIEPIASDTTEKDQDEKKDDKKSDYDDIDIVTPTDDTDSQSSDQSTPRSDTIRPKEAPKKSDDSGKTDPTPAPEAPDVSYKVYHKLMDLDGENYTTADTESNTGKGGTEVTPSTKSYEGFTAPATQTKTLPNDDSLEISYLYTRNKYNLTLGKSEFIDTITPSGDYFYDTPISLTAKNRPGYDFNGWTSSDSSIDGKTDATVSFNIGTTAVTAEPTYTARTDTPYKIVYETKDLTGSGYTQYQQDDKTGTTGSTVTPTPIDIPHFITPAQQSAEISGEGDTVITYRYSRESYHLTLTNPELIDTATGEDDYPYETTITLTAKDKTGYHFTNWTDGVTTNANTFQMTAEKTVGPEYAPNTYNVVFDSNASDATGTMSSQEITYDQETALNTNQFQRQAYNFIGWSQDPNATEKQYSDGQNVTNLAASGDITLYAVWADKFPAVWSIDGECIFNGKDGTITSSSTCQFGDTNYVGQKYIDTGIALNNAENFGKDFEVSFNIDSYSDEQDESQATLFMSKISTKHPISEGGSKSPGIIVRRKDDGSNDIEFRSAYKTGNSYSDKEMHYPHDRIQKVRFIRRNGIMYVSVNDEFITELQNLNNYYQYFDQTAWFGAYPNDGTDTPTAKNFVKATLSNLSIRLGEMSTEYYQVTFNGSGGRVGNESRRNILIEKGDSVTIMPAATRDHYIFEGWYIGNNKVEEGYTPTADVQFNAHWTKDASQASVSQDSFSLTRGDTAQLVISNRSSIEPVTLSSNDTSVATIDQDGNIVATGAGSTTLVITGDRSGATKEIEITVALPRYTVHFDSNDGTAVADITDIEEGGKISSLPTTTRTNYLFDGWFLQDGSTEFTTDTAVMSEMTVIAHWTKDITLATADDISVTRGETAQVNVTNKSEIEPFTYRSDNESIITIDSEGSITTVAAGNTTVTLTGTRSGLEKTIEVLVTLPKYTVSFDSNGGSAVAAITDIEEGSSISALPAEPTKANSVFNGWYTQDGSEQLTTSTPIMGNITYYAHWLGDIEQATVDPITVVHDSTAQINVTNKDNIESFSYSSDDDTIATVDSNGIVTGVNVDTTNIILTGTKSGKTKTVQVTVVAKKYTITFATDGGSAVENIEVTEGNVIGTLPTSQKEGYALEGWYNGSTKVDASFVPTGDTELSANWLKSIDGATAAAITVTRTQTATIAIDNANEHESFTCTSDDTTIATVVSNTCVVTGESAGNTTITLTGILSGSTLDVNITVEPIRYTVHFNSHGGSEVADIENVDENSFIANIPSSTLQDNVLMGWFTEETGGTELTTTTPITGETTYHAQWKKDITQATVSEDSITLTVGDDTNFSVTNSSELEPYTIAIQDTSIATFENGTITAVAEGTTTLIITGTKSNLTKSIEITVEAEQPVVVCKAAEELHTQECKANGKCNSYSDNDLVGAIKNSNGLITYGYIPNSKGVKAGDAYTCDVNNDSRYDEETERFYYLGDDGTNARLYYYMGFDGENGPSIIPSYHYNEMVALLPTTTQWSNPKLVPYDDNTIARFPSYDDITALCNVNSFNKCAYILEWTAFSQPKNDTAGPRSGIWLYSESSNQSAWRIHTGNFALESKTKTNSENAPRPVIQVALEDIEVPAQVNNTVSFNTMGGNPVTSIEDERGEIITLPNATKVGFTLANWSTTEDGSNLVGAAGDRYTISGDTTLYAVWQERASTAYIDGFGEDGYTTTLQKAIDKATTDGTKYTITLFKDVNESLSIATGKNIEFVFQGHTVSYGGKVIDNSGTITIDDVIINNTSDGSSSGAINNNSTGTIIMTRGTITSSGRQAVYNNGGQLEISGNSVLQATNTGTNKRATVHNLGGGTTIIKGGTISSEGLYAVYNESGTLIIGENDGYVDSSAPVITGKTHGVVAKNATSGTKYEIYDGTIRGETSAIGVTTSTSNPPAAADDTNNDYVSAIDSDSDITKTTDGDYEVLQLVPHVNKYRISLDANGGTVNPDYVVVAQGSEIGTIPEPSYPMHNFLGWFTTADGGTQVTSTTIPQGNDTYYAHWAAQSSDEIVEHNIQSNAVNAYFANIASWSAAPAPDTETTLWTNLKNNFETNQCKINSNQDLSDDWKMGTGNIPGEYYDYNYTASGDNYCDRPTGYDTGVNAAINVYLSNDNKDKLGEATYLSTANGVINNMIPNTIYRWELASNPNVYGYVKATGERRVIELSATRNVRDLGGLTGKDGKKIKYGRLIRGEWIQTEQDKTTLQQLGINKEYDLRNENEINGSTGGKHFGSSNTDYWHQLIHYDFNYGTANYATTRAVVESLMHDIVDNHSNIYFHCTHGADRTGTLAWLIESLLGVDLETRHQDYELTSLSGRPDRNRFYSHKNSATNKYTFMMGWMNTDYSYNAYDWYMQGSSNPTADAALITAFQNEMLEN